MSNYNNPFLKSFTGTKDKYHVILAISCIRSIIAQDYGNEENEIKLKYWLSDKNATGDKKKYIDFLNNLDKEIKKNPELAEHEIFEVFGERDTFKKIVHQDYARKFCESDKPISFFDFNSYINICNSTNISSKNIDPAIKNSLYEAFEESGKIVCQEKFNKNIQFGKYERER